MVNAATPTTVWIDLETCGLEPSHPIIQIGAIAMDDEWNEIEVIERKLHFVALPEHRSALELNGYDPFVWVHEAVPAVKAFLDFADFLKRHTKSDGAHSHPPRLAGHNVVAFDEPLLRFAFESHAIPNLVSPYSLDTLHLAFWRFRGVPFRDAPERYRLSTLARWLGVPVSGLHDAVCDARMSAAVARSMLEGEWS